jgi:hypothetical protein
VKKKETWVLWWAITQINVGNFDWMAAVASIKKNISGKPNR